MAGILSKTELRKASRNHQFRNKTPFFAPITHFSFSKWHHIFWNPVSIADCFNFLRNLYNVRGRTPVSIKREDAENIARLAKLQISDDQLEKITGDLSNILSLVDQLQAADTSNIEPMAHPMDAVQRLRPDQVTETNNREAFQKIAPATEEGLYLVPKVIE